MRQKQKLLTQKFVSYSWDFKDNICMKVFLLLCWINHKYLYVSLVKMKKYFKHIKEFWVIKENVVPLKPKEKILQHKKENWMKRNCTACIKTVNYKLVIKL